MTHDRTTTINAILQAHHTINRAIGTSSNQLWMELDLSMAQLKTLITLYDGGAMSIGQIAEVLGVGQPTGSHLVDRLVQSGLVMRTEDAVDRRRTVAVLSPQGRELIDQLREVRSEPIQRWLTQLDDEPLAALRLGLETLAAVAQAETTLVAQTS